MTNIDYESLFLEAYEELSLLYSVIEENNLLYTSFKMKIYSDSTLEFLKKYDELVYGK